MTQYYVRSGKEVDSVQFASSPKEAAKKAIKVPNITLGQQVFVNTKPIKKGKYNGEIIFMTDALLDEMVKENLITSFVNEDHSFIVVG